MTSDPQLPSDQHAEPSTRTGLLASPWFSVPLADYEAHMCAPHVMQAQLLGLELALAVKHSRADSVALVGAAGGNGLQYLDPTTVRRVVAVDFNEEFLAACQRRFKFSFESLEIACDDIRRSRPTFRPVGLSFAGLIAEYVGNVPLCRYLACATARGGSVVIVAQGAGTGCNPISRTNSEAVASLHDAFAFVDVDDLRRELIRDGLFHTVRSNLLRGRSGKTFWRIRAIRS